MGRRSCAARWRRSRRSPVLPIRQNAYCRLFSRRQFILPIARDPIVELVDQAMHELQAEAPGPGSVQGRQVQVRAVRARVGSNSAASSRTITRRASCVRHDADFDLAFVSAQPVFDAIRHRLVDCQYQFRSPVLRQAGSMGMTLDKRPDEAQVVKTRLDPDPVAAHGQDAARRSSVRSSSEPHPAWHECRRTCRSPVSSTRVPRGPTG